MATKTKGRMLKREISDSKGFASLSPKAAVLFCMIIPHLNSHGKLNGGPGFVKDEICPRVGYLTVKSIPGLLQEIHDATNIKWFKNDGRWWIHSINFLSEHQNLRSDRLGQDLLPSYSGSTPQEVEVEVEVKNPMSKSTKPVAFDSGDDIPDHDKPAETAGADACGAATPTTPNEKAQLFAFWIRTCSMGPPDPVFTPKRHKLLNERLKEGKTLDDLALAIEGCSLTPHNQGENERRQKYMDWELIMRDAAHVDRFIANHHQLRRRA